MLSGTATFEIGEWRQRVTVGEGEAIRIPPGEFQKGHNKGDERVVAVAIGAPGRQHDRDELEALLECEECGDETVYDRQPVGSGEWQSERVDLRVTCQECGDSVSTV